MLKFSRNKLVSIHRPDDETLAVHGVLDDDIYGLEVDVRIRLDDFTLTWVRGKWNRFTTPDCPRAIDLVQTAEGFRIDADLAAKLHKTVGRKACRHFANLLVECCDAATEAARILRWEDARKVRPDLTFDRFLEAGIPLPEPPSSAAAASAGEERPAKMAKPAVKPVAPATEKRFAGDGRDGFIVDLHAHTHPASPCSSVSVEDLIAAAKARGLNGICLTDHNTVWPKERVAELRRRHDFNVLCGNEITTDQGDILVFGFDEAITGIIPLAALRAKVTAAGGFMIAAHPFRGFLVFGAGELGLTVEKAMERPLFRHVDAVEMLNGKVTEKENRLAAAVAEGLGLPVTGGSDAHEAGEVGQFATAFASPVTSEGELVAALKAGAFKPVVPNGTHR